MLYWLLFEYHLVKATVCSCFRKCLRFTYIFRSVSCVRKGEALRDTLTLCWFRVFNGYACSEKNIELHQLHT